MNKLNGGVTLLYIYMYIYVLYIYIYIYISRAYIYNFKTYQLFLQELHFGFGKPSETQ